MFNNNKDLDKKNNINLTSIHLGPSWETGSILKKENFSSTISQKKKKNIRTDRTDRKYKEYKEYDNSLEKSFYINFYPEDEFFKKITDTIRQSKKIYKLFEISNLILENINQLYISIETIDSSNSFFCLSENKLPFETEEKAINYIFINDNEKYFNKENIEISGPKGTFSIINKCGITNELIGPPNFHLYNDIINEHYNFKLSHIPYNVFEEKIISLKDNNLIQEWLKGANKQVKYIPKYYDEKKYFSYIEAKKDMKNFLAEKLIFKTNKTKFNANLLKKLSHSKIKEAILQDFEKEKNFPFITSNNLRGRFRRMGFFFIKKNNKNITYVSSVKNRMRYDKSIFSEPIKKLLNILEENYNIKIDDIKTKYFENKKLSKEEEDLEFNKLISNIKWLIESGYIMQNSNGSFYIENLKSKSSIDNYQYKNKTKEVK